MVGQVAGEAVGDGDGAAGQQQLQSHGAADDVGGADHDGVQAVQVGTGACEQGHDALRRAGAQEGDALGQAADVVGMEAVHVLVRVDALQQLGGIEVGGEGQLDQNAVDGRVVVQAVDQRQQFFLGGAGGKIVGLGEEADLFAVLALVRDIDLRGGVGADQDHRQAGDAQALLAALVDALGNLLAEAGGDRFAVDQFCSHVGRANHQGG